MLFALAPRHSDPVARRLSCARSAPIGLFLGRLANFINGELWGRAADVPWAMVFPGGGPLPRHPSQLYEAALEGPRAVGRAGAPDPRRRLETAGPDPRRVLAGYGVARTICELFREPDAQLGLLWGGMTMGMLLSVPLMIAGVALIWAALARSVPRPG